MTDLASPGLASTGHAITGGRVVDPGRGIDGPLDVLLGVGRAQETGPVEQMHAFGQHAVVQLG